MRILAPGNGLPSSGYPVRLLSVLEPSRTVNRVGFQMRFSRAGDIIPVGSKGHNWREKHGTILEQVVCQKAPSRLSVKKGYHFPVAFPCSTWSDHELGLSGNEIQMLPRMAFWHAAVLGV